MMSISAVDLFCGAGGLTHGFILEGIPVNAGLDNDPNCRYSYEQNNNCRFIQSDIAKLSGEELKSLYPKMDVKVLAGCAPCQPFSTYTQGHSKQNDNESFLLDNFTRIVEELKPEIVMMENVVRLKKHQVFSNFIFRLKELGYIINAQTIFCPYYGIPQTRRRLVILSSVFGPIDFMHPTHKKSEFITVRNVIEKLEPIAAGEISKKDPLHRSSRLSELNLQRIRASRPGGAWRDWNKNLIAKCHKKNGGKTYPSVYGRMEWDKPAPTITTQCFGFGNGRFGHPEQDRAISLREAALLQTFPDYYDFTEPNRPVPFKRIGRMIGNAVPVRLARVIAKNILTHVVTK